VEGYSRINSTKSPASAQTILAVLQIKQPTRCTFSCKIFYCLNAAQHVSGNFLLIIRSTFELHPQPPVTIKCQGGCVSSRGHGWKHTHLGFYMGTGGCGCSSEVPLMMGKMLPETC
jgi:hypothetical protein